MRTLHGVNAMSFATCAPTAELKLLTSQYMTAHKLRRTLARRVKVQELVTKKCRNPRDGAGQSRLSLLLKRVVDCGCGCCRVDPFYTRHALIHLRQSKTKPVQVHRLILLHWNRGAMICVLKVPTRACNQTKLA